MIKVERKNNQMMISVEGDVATLAGTGSPQCTVYCHVPDH